jgi:phasin family protein
MRMTAKTPATKSKAPAKARRVVKASAPALTATAVSPADQPAEKAAVNPDQPVPAPAAEPRPAARVIPIAAAFNPKDLTMATAFETTQDAVRTTVSQLNIQAEAAINNGKAAMEQVAAKSKEAVEASMKSLDELTEMTRANVDALIASAKAATAGVEQVMTHLTETTRKSFEDTTAMVKTLAAAKTPNELMQLQSDFAKAQFDAAVADYSKLTEMMVKLAGEVMEPVQNQVALATDRMKAAWTLK